MLHTGRWEGENSSGIWRLHKDGHWDGHWIAYNDLKEAAKAAMKELYRVPVNLVPVQSQLLQKATSLSPSITWRRFSCDFDSLYGIFVLLCCDLYDECVF